MVKDEITQVAAGIGLGKGVQILIRKFADLQVAKHMLYTPAQYVKDLITGGYIRAAPTDTDDAIATAILTANGYTFSGFNVAGAAGNLTGTNKLTANEYTYRAAAGQKVAPWMFPSTWLSGITGGILTAEGIMNFTGSSYTRDKDVGVSALGLTLIADGAAHGIGIDGTVAAPSGFDIKSPPSMQYLSQEAQKNLQKLSAENQRLQAEITQIRNLRKGEPGAVDPHIEVAPGGTVYTEEKLPSKGAEGLKQQTHLLDRNVFRANAEAVKAKTGLVTLSGGR